ncbi:hypothetical protein H2201_006761 [Coniosporium apollinis]|uniref:Uncharacterized protein n=2 Tax=Coniosporium TaxID=2810619 RepID=A0ABQ9NPD3_9PEZI|nr:hypothetical protein H2199_007361 [Cladosporium sp. JES 115]KAJ9660869.1 hypothetical protein H2201_006761 [Coniosporium apollinis]
MTLYRLFRESVVTALIVETPFIELQKTIKRGKTAAKRTICLDYRTKFALKAWLVAMQNGHILLGCGMLLSFVVSILLVPLASGLFYTQTDQRPRTATINITSIYEAANLNASVDYGAVFEVVSASWLYGATPPSGTNGVHAFPAFEPSQPGWKTYNMTLLVNASGASLDCLSIESFSLHYDRATDETGTARFEATDRGCIVRDSFAVSSASDQYLKCASNTSCISDVGFSRMAFFYARRSESSENRLSDISFISCIPSYWSVPGNLSIVENATSSGSITVLPQFSPDKEAGAILDRPYTWKQFEQDIQNVLYVNPGYRVQTSALGNLILKYTAKGYTTLDAITLMASAKIIFPAIYAILCIQRLYQQVEPPTQRQGILRIPENRLKVAPGVAYIFIGILAVLVVESVVLLIYLQRHPTILAEEPVGLLGAANLLHGSDVGNFVREVHKESDFDGRIFPEAEMTNSDASHVAWNTLRKLMFWKKSKKTREDVLESQCWIKEVGSSAVERTIMLEWEGHSEGGKEEKLSLLRDSAEGPLRIDSTGTAVTQNPRAIPDDPVLCEDRAQHQITSSIPSTQVYQVAPDIKRKALPRATA